jgi:hypothetical protein
MKLYEAKTCPTKPIKTQGDNISETESGTDRKRGRQVDSEGDEDE